MEVTPDIHEIGKDLYKPIPIEVGSVAGWKEVPLQDNGEPLVAIGPFSGNKYDRIFTSSIYFGERADSPYGRDTIHGALITTFARREVAEQLIQADALLPYGLHLIVLDAYRTLDVQQSLYDQYLSALKRQKTDWTDQQLSEETQKFVSIPSTNPARPSPHNTGGSIDVAIYKLPDEVQRRVEQINERVQEIAEDDEKSEEVYRLEMERIGLIAQNAELLNFGTQWDYGGTEAALSYFEGPDADKPLSEEEQTARENRRLLYNVMIATGFEPYADEWWHYNSKKSQMGAKTAGLDNAEYGAADLSHPNWHHELVRRQHLKGTERLTRTPINSLDKLGRHVAWLDVAAEAAHAIGDMRETSLPSASVIKPPEQKAA